MKKANEVTLKNIYELAYGGDKPFETFKNEGYFAAANITTYIVRKNLENSDEVGIIDILAYLLAYNRLYPIDLEVCAEEVVTKKSHQSFDAKLYKAKCKDEIFDKARKALEKLPNYVLEKMGLDSPEYDTGERVNYLSYTVQDFMLLLVDPNIYFKVVDKGFNLLEDDEVISEKDAKIFKAFVTDFGRNSIKTKMDEAEAKKLVEKWMKLLEISVNDIKRSRREIVKGIGAAALTELEDKLLAEREDVLMFDNPDEVFSVEKIESISKKVVGQEKALESIKSRLLACNLGFKQPNQPVASFLLTGPTGVGKTETAKAVADACFGGKIYVVDMSTFKNSIDVSRLTGGSPNYVGYSDKNTFCDFIKENPNSVVLFDEVEKAHPECLDLVMRILDEGQFINAKGETISFENTVVFCTTNLTQNTTAKIGFGAEENTAEIVTKKDGFKKEIVGRFSDVIEYKSLEKKDCLLIAKAFLDKTIKAFETNNKYNIKLEYTDDLVEKITINANTKLLGARDLKKTIQTDFINVVADYIVKTNCVNTTLLVSADGIKDLAKRETKSTKKQSTKELTAETAGDGRAD